MSFDFSPNMNLSNVQASHKPSDGGGGNTGYFQRGNSEENNQYFFNKQDETDSFNLSITIDNDEEQDAGFIETIKKLFYKLVEKIKKALKIK